MSDIFISYSRQDKPFMEHIFAALEAADFQAWVDWDALPKGYEFPQEIEAGINAAHTLLLIISPASLASEWCNREIAYARQQHKRIIPVMHREVDLKHLAGEWIEKPWENDARDNFKAIQAINWIFFPRHRRF